MIQPQSLLYLFACGVLAALCGLSGVGRLRTGLLVLGSLGVTLMTLWSHKEFWLAAVAFSLGSFAAYHWIHRSASPKRQTRTVLILLGMTSAFLLFRISPDGLAYTGFAFLFLRAWRTFTAARDREPLLTAGEYVGYLMFFPVFHAGPVGRPEQFLSSFRNPERMSWQRLYDACFLIVLGLFQQLVISSTFSFFAINQASPHDLESMQRWQIFLLLYCYGLQLYFSFAGYSNMAMGIAGLLGVQVEKNFRAPFLAVNIQEFWARWHMSFTQWLREEVFYPVFQRLRFDGRGSVTFAALGSLWVTFLFAGAWHGTRLQFLGYGIYHALGFTVFLLWRHAVRSWWPKGAIFTVMWRLFSWGMTFNFIAIGWVFFTGRFDVFMALWKG